MFCMFANEGQSDDCRQSSKPLQIATKMAATALTKSYVDTHDPEHPVQDDLVMYEHFEKARKNGVVGEFVNLETQKRVTTTEIYDKADGYAKGLLAIGLVPGEDTFVVIGCSSMEAACLFTACSAVGVAYAHPCIYKPKDVSITAMLPLMEPKVVVVGEGAGGTTCTAFLELFQETDTKPSCDKLPFIEHIFYDNTYKDREPAHKCLKPLKQLMELGCTVTDEQLEAAKKAVKPEYRLFHLSSSGSTGQPKCVAHTHRGVANELLQLRVDNLEPVMTLNMNMSEVACYICLSWTLAGKISKTVIIRDMGSDGFSDDAAMVFTKAAIDEGIQYFVLPGSVQNMMRGYIMENNIDFPPIKLFQNGTQIVSRGFKENLKKAFKGMPLTQYGMSETYILAFTTLGDTEEDEEARLQSRLYPKPNIKLRIVDSDNEIVDIGKDGEIQVQTYSRFKEYRKQEQLTKDVFTSDGFLRTGDMAVMYPDGTFVIKGRIADAMRFTTGLQGEVIYPGPIEEVMSRYPAINDISVISVSTSDCYGDEIVYCIRLEKGAEKPTEEQLLTYGSANGLDESQRPSRIVFMEEFPYTANQRKVSKALLKVKIREMMANDPELGLCEWYKKLLVILAADV